MFHAEPSDLRSPYRLAILGLIGLNAAALAITCWVMVDFLREQEIVRQLTRLLPPAAADTAEMLAGELKWQFRLSSLVILNLIATAYAAWLLGRAYRSSQRSLYDIKVLAGDILSSMDQAVITTDQAGTVTSINRRGCELLDTHASALGKPLSEACRVIDLESFRRQSLPLDPSRVVRDFVVTHGGVHRTLRAFCQPLNDSAGRMIGAVLQLRDVSERALMEQQVQRMERFMELGSLAAGLHHEIKNPLSALSLHVQLLEEQIGDQQASDETLDILDVLKTEVARIIGVLESFRNYASIDVLDCSHVALAELLERQIRLIAPQALAAGIHIERNIDAALPRVWADAAKLEQVVLNLLINAMEAMTAGGRLTVSAAAVEGRILVQFADTGCGIPEGLRQRIFDPYFTTKGHGTGMGLALCDKIVRQHGGTLELRPSPQGALFVISLPLERP